MKFLNPAGLWLLLGIPLLIVIYLIKAQHEEVPVSSTFIWKLSGRFMKKRRPMQKARKILLFLLQLLLVAAVAFLAAKPVIENGASRDYVVILDASASMQTVDENGISRFDKALDEIEALSDKIVYGHSVSLILAAEDASVLLERSTSQSEVKMTLENLRCTYGRCNEAEGLRLAQLLCDSSPNPTVLFYTDCSHPEGNNVSVINLNEKEWNVAVEQLSSVSEERATLFTGSVTSYHKDATVTVGLKVDGYTVDAQIVECTADVPKEITFYAQAIPSFDTAEIYVEIQDALEADNAFALCQKSNLSYKTLLISTSPTYLTGALQALGICDVKSIRSLPEEPLSGWDLYVFDGVAPKEYPTDGAIIQIGTENLPAGLKSGASASDASLLTKNSVLSHEVLQSLSLEGTEVLRYTPLTLSSRWDSLLLCGDSTVVATGKPDGIFPFTVIAFDLHNSNLPMQPDFPILIRNLVSYSMPALLKDMDHTAGETLHFTVLPGGNELSVTLPDQSVKYLSTRADEAAFLCETTGIHTAVLTGDELREYVQFFVHVPKNESVDESPLPLSISIEEKTTEDAPTAISKTWHWIAGLMLLLLLLEWGWYYREQY